MSYRKSILLVAVALAVASSVHAQSELFQGDAYTAYYLLEPGSASFRVIPSVWGHQAGNGLNPADSGFIDEALKGLLAA